MFFKKRPPKLTQLSDLKINELPPLRADALVSLLGLDKELFNIQRFVGIDSERFEQLYLVPINRFLELSQLAPASTDYHHTGLGGLARHTLSMTAIALHERRKYELPLRSDPEIQQHQRHLWTYAVFTASLLHDIGKLVTLVRFKIPNGHFNPYGAASLHEKCDHYSMEFIQSPYSLHQRLSATFLQIIPKLGQEFLASNINVLEQLMGFFNDHPYDWGSIGEIVKQADQESVAADLRLGTKARLPNAPASPLHERLLTSLRQLIREGELRVNTAGAAIWVKGDYAYVLSKLGADRMREFITELGGGGVPSDNLRLFDALQQFNYVFSTPSNRAIWRIRVRVPADGFDQTFTVLKFDKHRLFHVKNMPKDLIGAIDEQDSTNTDLEQSNVSKSVNPATGAESGPTENPKPGAVEKKNSSQKTEDLTKNSNEATGIPTPASEAKLEPQSTDKPTDMEVSSDVGEEFISWVRNKIDSKVFELNANVIHIVNYKNREGQNTKAVALVSPKIFKDFAEETEKGQKDAHLATQKSLHKLNLAIKNGRYHVHKYRIKSSPSPKAMLTFYLFETSVFFDDDNDLKVNESLAFTPH